jgi:endonuclease-3 related protein
MIPLEMLPSPTGLSVKKSNTLPEIYRRLFARYGPQHWWPGDTPFEVMVGAILTQSTAWQNVEKAINNLKSAGILSPEAIRRLPLAEIARLIHPCGYYNAKARKLKALVDWLGAACDDNLERLFATKTDELRKQLLAVHGVGPETADSILLYAADKPIFVIDAYTRRVLSRLSLVPEKDTYDEYQQLFMQNLPSDVRLFNEYHALFVRLGKIVCRKQPLCLICCLFDICLRNEAR